MPRQDGKPDGSIPSPGLQDTPPHISFPFLLRQTTPVNSPTALGFRSPRRCCGAQVKVWAGPVPSLTVRTPLHAFTEGPASIPKPAAWCLPDPSQLRHSLSCPVQGRL